MKLKSKKAFKNLDTFDKVVIVLFFVFMAIILFFYIELGVFARPFFQEEIKNVDIISLNGSQIIYIQNEIEHIVYSHDEWVCKDALNVAQKKYPMSINRTIMRNITLLIYDIKTTFSRNNCYFIRQ